MAKKRFSQKDLERLGDRVIGKVDNWDKMEKINNELRQDIAERIKFNISDNLVFEWSGKTTSLNKFYEARHWMFRSKMKIEWHLFFKRMIPKGQKKFDKFRTELRYNSKLDADNTIMMVKFCHDTLTKEKIIIDDKPKYCRGVYLIPDETMDKNSLRITIFNVN